MPAERNRAASSDSNSSISSSVWRRKARSPPTDKVSKVQPCCQRSPTASPEGLRSRSAAALSPIK
jgi:hypothetical protein